MTDQQERHADGTFGTDVGPEPHSVAQPAGQAPVVEPPAQTDPPKKSDLDSITLSDAEVARAGAAGIPLDLALAAKRARFLETAHAAGMTVEAYTAMTRLIDEKRERDGFAATVNINEWAAATGRTPDGKPRK